MIFSLVKTYLKKNFPKISNKLIQIRDNGYLKKLLNNTILIKFNKNIHGKKIVNDEKGFVLDFSKDNYISYTIRPKKSKNIAKQEKIFDEKDTAIIIQGSLYGIKDFVSETIDLYLKNFKNSKIILSTWKGDVSEKINLKYKDKISIIENEKPKNNIFNTNLQIISTYNALNYAKQLNLKFCLKTRTDCRIYNNNTINHLKNLQKIFPIDENYKNLNERIISCSIDTRKFRVYGLSDILLFSNTDNLLKYFNNEMYEISLKKNFGNYPCLINETAVINEIFLCARFLKSLDLNLDWTLEDWWKKCSEIFCVIDPSSIDFFWFKYHWKYEQRFLKNYTTNNSQALSFADWLNLYLNKDFSFEKKNKETWKIKNGIFVQ
ncbi:MAG: hypothetical protein CMD36_08115 [Flavobacteriales bacterium]|nr:hypothetical protein [Flavobacteriales bacterium]